MVNNSITLETTPNTQQNSKIAKETKEINLAIFGHGTVGGTLIDQIYRSKKEILKRKKIKLNVFAIANSKSVVLQSQGIGANWRNLLSSKGKPYNMEEVITFAKENQLENLIAVDNTSSDTFLYNYPTLIKNGFSLVASNKIANTIDLQFYKAIRKQLKKHQQGFLYETNVGAGLPLIDTIKLLHLSGENITRIQGIFSGSLSYIFNEFSSRDVKFSEVLSEAINSGFTEPDPREDLCGKDVARKLLILARELDLHNEIEDIKIVNLIPEELREVSKTDFINQTQNLDIHFSQLKSDLKKGHVLRYVGNLHGDLSKEDGAILEVKLLSVPTNSPLGALKGSDSIFEIYTESYGNNPIVIQGAGAGAAVTARGVFGDILRLAQTTNNFVLQAHSS